MGAVVGHFHVAAEAGDAVNLLGRLEDQFLAVRQDKGAAREGAADDVGKDDGFARACRQDQQCRIHRRKLAPDRRHRLLLIRTQLHSAAPRRSSSISLATCSFSSRGTVASKRCLLISPRSLHARHPCPWQNGHTT